MCLLRICLWAMCAGLHLQAGAQGFNERFDLFDEGEGQFAWGVEVDATGTSVVFFGGDYVQDSVQYGSAISTTTVTPDGVFSDGFRLHIPWHNSYVGWANCASPIAGGGYIIGSSTSVPGDTSRAALFWFDESGIVTNYVELDLPGTSWIGRQAKQTPDGGYVLCGETSTVGFVDAFILKTDTGGAVQWVRTYGGPSTDNFTSVDMDPTSGGYFSGGTHHGTGSTYQLWVQSMNDTGAVLWSKIWGSPYDEFQVHVTTLHDGNILAASNWGTAVGNTAKYLAKLDRSDGSIIWSHTYGSPCEGCVFLVGQEISPGGDLIAVGHTRVPGDSYYGSMLRTTNAGDSLWMRNYLYTDDSVSHGQALFSDVQPTPDGGFIAVGVALAVAGVYGQDVWVIKTDSLGCIEPGCNLVTGMEAQITNMRDALHVYPNPVVRGAALHVEIELPAYFTAQGALRLTVTDALGRKVLEKQLAAGSQSASLPVTGALAVPGVYHLHLSDASRWISGVTFVVE